MGVGQIAERFCVLDVAVHVRDQSDRNQLRLAVDHFLHIGQIDMPVAMLDDAHVHPRLAAADVIVN